MLDFLAVPRQLLPVQLPLVEPEVHRRNFVQLAVCELRFPVLMDFDDKLFQRAYAPLRKLYPRVNRAFNVNLAAMDSKEAQYEITSRDNDWSVVLRPASVAIQAAPGKYTNMGDIISRLRPILKDLPQHLDIDFFTRVGLRFVNLLPAPAHEMEGWVNPRLLSAFSGGELGSVSSAMQEIRGRCDPRGTFVFKHGFQPELVDGKGERSYVIDIDAADEDVEPVDVEDLLLVLNRNIYAIFRWAIGPRMLKEMEG